MNLSLQALTFPLHLRLFLPLPRLLRKLGSLRLLRVNPPPPPSVRGAWPIVGVGGRPSWLLVGSPLPLLLFGGRGGGGGEGTARALASGSLGDSAASSLPGVGVAVSSCSQESLVLADPSLVASSAELSLFTVFSLAW